MSLTPSSATPVMMAENLLSSLWERLQGAFSHHDFVSDAALAPAPGVDPRFLPRVPMSNAQLDVHILDQLGKMGYKRGKEITAATHPELYQAWTAMSQRAGLKQAPQLILAESNALNAAAITPEEVVVTTGLLKRLDFRELCAVLGHELGHESSNHTKPRAIAMSIFGGGGLLLGDRIAYKGGIGGHIAWENIKDGRLKRFAHYMLGSEKKPLSLLGYVAYMTIGIGIGGVIANQISVRPTELEADHKGVAISGDPEALISALSKLEASNKRSSIGKFLAYTTSGYPSMPARIEKLRAYAATLPPQAPVASASATTTEQPLTPTPTVQVSRVEANERLATQALPELTIVR